MAENYRGQRQAVTDWRRYIYMNKFFFVNKIHLFANFLRFFAKWGLFFAKWGLLLYVRKSLAVLLNLGHPIAPLLFVCAKLLSLSAQLERNAW